MIRAVSVTLKYLTQSKQRKINALIEAYRHCVNQYLNLFQTHKPKLDKITLDLVQVTKLSQRYKSNALKQAIGIHKGCVKKAKKIPKFNGFPVLDAKFVSIESGENSFDLAIRLSSLSKGNKITLLTKCHQRLKYWLGKGTLKQSCELRNNKLILYVEVEDESWKKGKAIGVDLGMNKLIVTSDGEFLGQKFKQFNDKILSKKKNSVAYKKAIKELHNYINQVVNQIDFTNIGVLCYENLKNLTKGKSKLRQYKKYRIKQQHWSYRKVITRIIEKCQENRVRPVYVDPRNTSRTCPACGNVAEANRNLEKFCCITCGYKQDADLVGAINILRKGCDWLESLESSNNKTCKTII